jgi:hypothetical protein
VELHPPFGIQPLALVLIGLKAYHSGQVSDWPPLFGYSAPGAYVHHHKTLAGRQDRAKASKRSRAAIRLRYRHRSLPGQLRFWLRFSSRLSLAAIDPDFMMRSIPGGEGLKRFRLAMTFRTP